MAALGPEGASSSAASLDASSGAGEAATIATGRLRRGVRLELLVAPIFLLPLGIGLLFIDLGLRRDLPGYLAVGVLLIVSNVVFGVLMVRNAMRFLRHTRSPRRF